MQPKELFQMNHNSNVMIKNYYNFDDFGWLTRFSLTKTLVDANGNYTSFLNNLPETEKSKLKTVREASIIKMYSVLLKTDLNTPAGEEQPLEFFNINIDTPEDNYNNGEGKLVKEIQAIFDMNYYDYRNYSKYFKETLLNIDYPFISTAWIMSYKRDAIVSPHTHNDELLFAHILLEDISEGEFEIQVNREIKTLNKAGDYFIFPGQLEHSARFSGNNCSFLSFSILNK